MGFNEPFQEFQLFTHTVTLKEPVYMLKGQQNKLIYLSLNKSQVKFLTH